VISHETEPREFAATLATRELLDAGVHVAEVLVECCLAAKSTAAQRTRAALDSSTLHHRPKTLLQICHNNQKQSEFSTALPAAAFSSVVRKFLLRERHSGTQLGNLESLRSISDAQGL
jgi:hypothetical protein